MEFYSSESNSLGLRSEGNVSMTPYSPKRAAGTLFRRSLLLAMAV